jgi:predicted  nucleic acid-binding Zn-ribbon protein
MDSYEKLQELWYRLTIAYECNNLKEMQETEVLINALLKQLDIGTIEIDIPDIEDKIEELLNEIEEIKSRDPYQYKFLLDDTEAVKEKKQSLQDELKEYEEYSAKLDEILGGMMLNGASFTFVMK